MAKTQERPFRRTRSRTTLRALSAVEAPQVMDFDSDFPIVIERATGARVVDVDGNRYLDLTSFFGAALVGHRNPRVVASIRAQMGRLLHGMGDVHPPAVKARFLSRLVRHLPAPDYRAVLSLNGADAVECALKFAAAATGRPGVIAFHGAYHGLTAGALEVTWNPIFRQPFEATLSGRGRFAAFPASDGSDAAAVLQQVRDLARAGDVGAVIVEPIQGRGGIRVSPPGFLPALSVLAADLGLVLIADEVYSGAGRTGTFLAGDAEGLVPDIICLGKALGGGLPISACLMRPPIASAVRGAGHEAVHTSTFLGHPLGCAAGIGVLQALDRGLGARAGAIGDRIRARATSWQHRHACVHEVRGRGAMMGIVLDAGVAAKVVQAALRRGVLVLTEGPRADVLALTPPLVLTDRELDRALDRLESAIEEAAG